MTNTDKLRDKIASSGLKLEFVAQQMGITRQSLSKKINNHTSFDQYEIAALCDILNVTSLSEKEALFFCR